MEMTDKCLIFANWPDGLRCFFPWNDRQFDNGPAELRGRIDHVANYKDGFIPVAWAPYGTPTTDSARAESIAAGRTIELVDGKYIPRGVPGEPEKKEPAKSIGALIQAALSDSHCAMRDSDTNPKPALTWNTKTPFDPFKGWGPARRYDADDYMPAVSTGHPLQKLGDTSNPLHGSAHFANKG